MHSCEGANEKAEIFQSIMLEQLKIFFPIKSFKVCSEDQAWVTKEVKKLDNHVRENLTSMAGQRNGRN